MINKKKFILVLIIFAAVLAFLLTSARVYNFFTSSDVLELKFQKGLSYRIEKYNKDILFINNEEMQCINDRGQIVWNTVTGVSEPVVSVSGEYILITDVSGNTALLYKKNKLIHKFILPNSIYCAKVNKNGYTVFVTSETGYKGMFTVFSPGGKETYRWHSGSGYIADVDISTNNNIIVSQIITDNSFVTSKILHFNIKKDKETECSIYENELFSHVHFHNDNSFIALSDTRMIGFSSKCSKKYETDFLGRTIVYYNTSNMNNIVLAFKGSVNDTIIESYSHSGKLKGTYRPSEDIDSIDVCGELIVTSSGKKIIIVSPSGKIKSKKDIDHEANNLKIFSGRKKVVLIGGNNASIYSIY